MRNSGFYWVKRCGDWIVAEWNQPLGYWYIAGCGYGFDNGHLIDQIDERRIVREVE